MWYELIVAAGMYVNERTEDNERGDKNNVLKCECEYEVNE
jgi:hypothetical protein